MKQIRLLMIILMLVLGSNACVWTTHYVKPTYKIPERPKIEIGHKDRADKIIGMYLPNKERIFEDYIIEHKNELKKDTITIERLKAHIIKLENIIKALTKKN